VLVTVSSSSTETQGEIHTLFHDSDKDKAAFK